MKTLKIFSLITMLIVSVWAAPAPVYAAQFKFTLTITYVEQIDDVDGFAADFYPKVSLGASRDMSKPYIDDQRLASPNWTFRQAVADDEMLPIVIELWDYDWPDPNDKCDISPVKGRKELHLTYDVRNNWVWGDVYGSAEQEFTVAGWGDSDRALIRFRITREDAPSPLARGVYPESLPTKPTCGSGSHTEVHGDYEITSVSDVPCPWINSITPEAAVPGQWIEVRGQAFGERPDMIGTDRGEKHVVLTLLPPGGGLVVPTPVLMEAPARYWTSTRFYARVPDQLVPGTYRMGIMYPLLPGTNFAYGYASNMVTLIVRSSGR